MANLGLDAQHISSNLRDYEAARTGFFTLVVTGLNGIIRADYSGDPEEATDADRILNAEEILTLNVTKSSVPHFSLTPLEYKRGNEIIKFAGTPTFEAGKITVDDIVGVDTKSILEAWKALAYNVHTRKGGRMKDYKKMATLTEYTQDYTKIRSWNLYGCWVSDIDDSEFDKGNDGVRQLGATIQYDRAEMIID